MSSSRDNGPAPLSLEGHADVPAGQSTQSTDAYIPQDVIARMCAPIPRPEGGPIGSNSEPSPGVVPDLDSDVSSRSSEEAAAGSGPYQNSFAREAAQNRTRSGSDARAECSGDTNTGVAAQPNGNGHAKSSIQSTPSEFYFPYEVSDEYRLCREAAMHAESFQWRSSGERNHNALPSSLQLTNPAMSLLSPVADHTLPQDTSVSTQKQWQLKSHIESSNTDTANTLQRSAEVGNTKRPYYPSSPGLSAQSMARVIHRVPSVQSRFFARPNITTEIIADPTTGTAEFTNIGIDRDELPARPDPPAPTTVDRLARRFRHTFGRGKHPSDQGIEMRALNCDQASESDPHLRPSAEVTRDQQQRRQHQGRGSHVQQVQQHAPGSGVALEQNISSWALVGYPVAGIVLMVLIGGSVISRHPV